ncbi:MAG: class I adenylate-forming enzyme family protein [Nitrospirota bacterium]
MNIVDQIKQETKQHVNRAAVIEGNRRITYGELLTAADQFAAFLHQKGVEQYDRIGLLCDDSPEYIMVSLAILSLSAVIVPISPEQTSEEIDTVIERIDLNFLIADAKLRSGEYQDTIQPNDFIKKELVFFERRKKQNHEPEYSLLNPAFIRFSSGTTGISKGVVLSHEAILERTDAANKGLRITSHDIVLWVLSMSYHFVVTILLFLRRAATIVLCTSRFPDLFIEGIVQYHGTFLYASPFHYDLLTTTDAIESDALRHVRLAISTAMKLPEKTAEAFFSRFGLELTEAYGIIEVGLPFIKLSGNKEKRGSVGKILPDFTVRLLNPDENGVGEIHIQGKGMLDAYYSPWQGREQILSDGWFKTGDLGKIDSDGFLFIVGRDKNVINFAGMKVFPEEIESVLKQHPFVKESRVHGTPHPQYGQLPVATIVLNTGIHDSIVDDLRRFCYHRLAQYKVPKEFIFTDRLLKTASGKIKR